MTELLVFYDGECAFCRRTMETLERYDWRNRLKGISFRNPEVISRYHLADKHVEQRIYVFCQEKNKGFSGIYAVAEIFKRLPLFRPLVPFVNLSIFLGLGQPCYDFIASRRQMIPIGQCDRGKGKCRRKI